MHEQTQKKGKKNPLRRNKMLHFQHIYIIANTGFLHGLEKQNLHNNFLRCKCYMKSSITLQKPRVKLCTFNAAYLEKVIA